MHKIGQKIYSVQNNKMKRFCPEIYIEVIVAMKIVY